MAKTILILGNGFDLAHGLPTRYVDFLKFCRFVMWASKGRNCLLVIDNWKVCPAVRDAVKDACQKKCAIINEIETQLKNNIWWNFFDEIMSKGLQGPNWIDFEAEIRNVIKFADRNEEDMTRGCNTLIEAYKRNPKKEHNELYSAETKLRLFGEKSESELKNKYREEEKKKSAAGASVFSNELNTLAEQRLEKLTVHGLRESWYEDLERLIRALELYFSHFVEAVAPDELTDVDCIVGLGPDCVLNFNYTNTYERLYCQPDDFREPQIFHIHGRCEEKRKADDNDMVLGIDDYFKTSEEAQEHINYAAFKKYVQRIVKGHEVKNAQLLNSIEGCPLNVYVFGHSLDRTDKDILAAFFKPDDANVTVYCCDKSTKGALIANMISLIGKEEMLAKIQKSMLRFAIP